RREEASDRLVHDAPQVREGPTERPQVTAEIVLAGAGDVRGFAEVHARLHRDEFAGAVEVDDAVEALEAEVHAGKSARSTGRGAGGLIRFDRPRDGVTRADDAQQAAALASLADVCLNFPRPLRMEDFRALQSSGAGVQARKPERDGEIGERGCVAIRVQGVSPDGPDQQQRGYRVQDPRASET